MRIIALGLPALRLRSFRKNGGAKMNASPSLEELSNRMIAAQRNLDPALVVVSRREGGQVNE